MSQNQASHSSRPSTSGKARPFASFCIPVVLGDAPLASGWFLRRRASSLGPATFLRPCSFVRVLNARRVSPTPPIVLKLQGLAPRPSFAGRAYHCCSRFPPLNWLLSVRRRRPASRDP
jgi:hypothetical protein